MSRASATAATTQHAEPRRNQMLKSIKKPRCPAPPPSPDKRTPLATCCTGHRQPHLARQCHRPHRRRSALSAAISPSACSSIRANGSLFFTPSAQPPVQPPSPASPTELIRFAPDESATPQLTGWWIPSDPGGRYSCATILFLADGDGSLARLHPHLASLHNLGVNIFAFDYRGYGQSAPIRPSQQSMTQDTESAWQYLTTSRASSHRNKSFPTARRRNLPRHPSRHLEPCDPRPHPRLTPRRSARN